MCPEPIMLLAEPEQGTCALCGRQTVKDYTPYTPVCLACAWADKAQGHRQEGQSVKFRGFEPS